LQLIQVLQGGQRAFSTETVQAPKEHQVKAPLVDIGKKGLKFGAPTLSTRLLLHLLLIDRTAAGLRKTPQFGQLVFGALTFILGRDAGIEGDGCHALKILQ
jgi:hypothetical protein